MFYIYNRSLGLAFSTFISVCQDFIFTCLAPWLKPGSIWYKVSRSSFNRVSERKSSRHYLTNDTNFDFIQPVCSLQIHTDRYFWVIQNDVVPKKTTSNYIQLIIIWGIWPMVLWGTKNLGWAPYNNSMFIYRFWLWPSPYSKGTLLPMFLLIAFKESFPSTMWLDTCRVSWRWIRLRTI